MTSQEGLILIGVQLAVFIVIMIKIILNKDGGRR